jgi:hypothetical protein
MEGLRNRGARWFNDAAMHDTSSFRGMLREAGRRLLRPAAVHAILLVLLLALLFPATFLRGEYISPADLLFAMPPWNHYAPEDWERPQNPIMADIVTLFYPMYYEVERSFARGEWPLWNRLELGGMPLLANYQTAIFYPPRLLYRVLDVPAAMTVHILLKLWLCGMTAYICGRGLGLAAGSSRFFGVAWMLGTYNVMFAPWSLPDVSAWIPILFLGVHYITQGWYRKGFWVATAGAVMLLLSGHPELAFGAALGIGWYFAAVMALSLRPQAALRAAFVCAGFWTVALLVSSVQIVPFLEYYLNSSNDYRLMIAKDLWLKPGSLVAYWVPRFFGLRADHNFWGDQSTLDYSMLYPGIAVWLGAGLLVGRRGGTAPLPCPTATRGTARAHRAAIVPALLIASALQLGLAFEAPGIGAINHLPLLNAMAPYWHAVFPIFALPLLAALGMERWCRRSARDVTGRVPAVTARDAVTYLVVVVLPGLVVVGSALAFHDPLMRMLSVDTYVWRQVGIAGTFLALGLLTLGIAQFVRRPRLLAPALTVLLAADLIIAARGINPSLPVDQAYPRTALTDYLRTLPEPSRIGIAEARVVTGVMAPYEIEEWLGYDGLYPERVLRLQTELGAAIWQAMEPACAIQYYLHDPVFPPTFPLEEPGRFSRVTALDGIEVYRNNRALPHAYFCASVETEPSPERLFERMKSPEFDPRRSALVLAKDAPGALPRESAEPGTAEVVVRRGTYVQIAAHTPEPQVLVLADAHYPGWTARINGEPAEIFPVFYAFRGIVVPEGAHSVEFFYRPWSFYGPLLVSTVVLLAMLAFGAMRSRTRG